MRRFAVIDLPSENRSGDQFETICANAKDAMVEAGNQWDYLTKEEKQKRRIVAVEYLPPDWAEDEEDLEIVGDWVKVFWDSEQGGFSYFKKEEIENVLEELDSDDPLYVYATDGTSLYDHIKSCSNYTSMYGEGLWDDIFNMMEDWCGYGNQTEKTYEVGVYWKKASDDPSEWILDTDAHPDYAYASNKVMAAMLALETLEAWSENYQCQIEIICIREQGNDDDDWEKFYVDDWKILYDYNR